MKKAWSPYKENMQIIGYNQVGKTEDVIKTIRDLRASEFNVLVIDANKNRFPHLDPFAVKRSIYDVTGKGFEILVPSEISQTWLDMVCKYIFQKFRNLVVIIDELHSYFDNKYTNPPNVRILYKQCNNSSIGIISIFHSPAEVPSFVLRTANISILFYIDLPTDIDYCSKWISPLCQGFTKDPQDPSYIPKFKKIYKKRYEQAVVE